MATQAISRTLITTLIAALILPAAADAVPAFSGSTPVTYSFFSSPARAQIVRPITDNVPTAHRLAGSYGMPTANQTYPSIPDGAILVFQARQTGLDAVLRQSVSIYSYLGSSQLRLGNYANIRSVTNSTTTPSGLNFVEGESASGGGDDSVAIALGASAGPLAEPAEVVLHPFGSSPSLDINTLISAVLGSLGDPGGDAAADAATVPEPATLGLFCIGAAMLRRISRK